ncbi:hypothetical protein AB0J63_47065 [Streptosporangium canum]|uniref:hypothetical protein n=1 Tax=Streptosporangium canum TaxID=324952 RepID=UPI00341A86AD
MIASDEVAMPPQDWAGEDTLSSDRSALGLASPALPDPGSAAPDGEWAMEGRTLAALRPSLSALQILRC